MGGKGKLRQNQNEEGEKSRIDQESSSTSTSLIPWEINEATAGIAKCFRNIILKLRNQDNAVTIARFILSMKNEINLSDNYRMSLLRTLSDLSNFISNEEKENKTFSKITEDDLLLFLNSFRKAEPIDPQMDWHIQLLSYHNIKILQMALLS